MRLKKRPTKAEQKRRAMQGFISILKYGWVQYNQHLSYPDYLIGVLQLMAHEEGQYDYKDSNIG